MAGDSDILRGYMGKILNPTVRYSSFHGKNQIVDLTYIEIIFFPINIFKMFYRNISIKSYLAFYFVSNNKV